MFGVRLFSPLSQAKRRAGAVEQSRQDYHPSTANQFFLDLVEAAHHDTNKRRWHNMVETKPKPQTKKEHKQKKYSKDLKVKETKTLDDACHRARTRPIIDNPLAPVEL
jgi:hypothetical protein